MVELVDLVWWLDWWQLQPQGEGGGGLHQQGARLATLLPPSSLIKCATSGFELLPGMKQLRMTPPSRVCPRQPGSDGCAVLENTPMKTGLV